MLFSASVLNGQSVIHVTDQNGIGIPFATVHTHQSNQSGETDQSGYITLRGLDVASDVLHIDVLGYKTWKKNITFEDTLIISLKPDAVLLNSVVVSGNRSERSRRDLAIPIDIVNQEALQNTQALTLADGMSFQGGLRIESNCQTCNFTQVRMNGLAGGYTQILLDSRPIFSSLMGLYGLEQIPSSLVERMEIVRGGGSALFGSSAIAGTINIITKRPESPSFSVSTQATSIYGQATDLGLNAHTSMVSQSGKSGIMLLTSLRDREEWDANEDGYSELPRIRNISFGLSGFVDLSEKSSLDYSFHTVQEDRNGGDLLDQPSHLRTQSEERDTRMNMGQIGWKHEYSSDLSSQTYAAGQWTRRSHYTGIDGSDGYGKTRNSSLQVGQQWIWILKDRGRLHTELLAGIEHQRDMILDEIPAYGYLIDQSTNETGLFVQGDLQWGEKWTASFGLRGQQHSLMDGLTALPRLHLKYDFHPDWTLRTGYGRGFRPPQAFDADLHIAFAGGGISTVVIDPTLEAEYSDSWTMSLEYLQGSSRAIYGGSAHAFYTRLDNAFFIKDRGTDASGNTILEKTSSSGSRVFGMSVETRCLWGDWLETNASATWQESLFNQAVQWSENLEGSRQYMRTPNLYGYFTTSLFANRPLGIKLSGVYTGSMLVPHFGGAPGVPEDELTTSPNFWEVNAFVEWRKPIAGSSRQWVISAGVQNIFHAYQDDFDIGKERDSNYIYGPLRPRTLLIKITYKGG